MRIAFQLTETDFREAQLGRPPRVRHLIAAVLRTVLIVLVILFPMGIWVIRGELNARSPMSIQDVPIVQPETPGERAWHLFRVTSPVLIMMVWTLGMTLIASVRAVPLPWLRRGPDSSVSPIAIIVVVSGSLLLLWSFNQPRTAYEGALTVPAFALIFVSTAISIVLNQTVMLRRSWNAQRSLHLATTMEVTEQGRLVFQHALATLDYQWAAIEGYKETANLLLLYLSPLSLWIIPKRAFVNPIDLGHFKGLLTVHVPAGLLLRQQQVTGFPVMPGPMTPPMPVLPPAQPPPIPGSEDRSASEK